MTAKNNLFKILIPLFLVVILVVLVLFSLWGYLIYSEKKKYLTSDVGKECFSTKDCEGYCTLPNDVVKKIWDRVGLELEQSQINAIYGGSDKRGVCSKYNANYESTQLHFEEGNIGFIFYD